METLDYKVNILESHLIPPGILNQRLSDYVGGLFISIPSRKGMKKAIKKGRVLLNGRTGFTGDWVNEGMEILLLESLESPPKPYCASLEILWEDEHLTVIEKPPGMLVSGNVFRTVQNALLFNLTPSSEFDSLPWPRPVHRLDKATGGLLLVAKTARAVIDLGKQLENKKIRKVYEALVCGEVNQIGCIEEPIRGQEAITKYELIRKTNSLKNQWISHIKVQPITGRMHQIRIHMAGTGHPVLGDGLYGTKGNVLLKKGLFLYAVTLEFKHPVTGQLLRINKSCPSKFLHRLENEQKRWDKYHFVNPMSLNKLEK